MKDCRFTQCSLGYVHSATSVCSQGERFSYDLEMKTREQNRNNKRTEIEQLDWFIELIQTRAVFGWLSERSGEKNLYAQELRFDVILQHDWPIEQCLLHIRVFFGGKTKKSCFDLFIYWLIKQITNAYRNYFSRLYENRSNLKQLNTQFFNWSKIRLVWCELALVSVR